MLLLAALTAFDLAQMAELFPIKNSAFRTEFLFRVNIADGGQRIHDPVPNAGLPPPNEAIIASGAGTISFRQIAQRLGLIGCPFWAALLCPRTSSSRCERLIKINAKFASYLYSKE